MSNTVYPTRFTHVLVIAAVVVDDDDDDGNDDGGGGGYIWLLPPSFSLHTQNWLYPTPPRGESDLLTPQRTQSSPTEVTVKQHSFLKA